MLLHILILLFASLVIATPPACFINCINSISHICGKNQADVKCLCRVHEAINQCISNYCPSENFYSSRDHFSGTCMEHGFEFEGPVFEDGPNELPESDIESDIEDNSDEETSDAEETVPFEDPESLKADASDVEGWSEDEKWSGEDEEPEESNVDLSELNQDVIKNYMSYFLKQKPSTHPHVASLSGVHNDNQKVVENKKPLQRPIIVHGPSNYAPSSKKMTSERNINHKSRFHKYSDDFNSEKQDQILRKRLWRDVE
ncbi:hypothetical protein OXX80_002160 [Metschnikowia pulcherrima]